MNPTNSADALKQMQDFGSSRKSLGDIYSGAQQELGVSEAQKRASELKNLTSSTENLIRGVDPSVTGRLQGGLATEAQRQRLVALETAPLTDLYRTQSSAYGDAQGDYRDLFGQANELGARRYQGDSDKFNNLQNLYNNLYGREQADEEKRRWEQQQAEQRRQFEAQLAESRRASTQSATTPSIMDVYSGIEARKRADEERQAAIEKEAQDKALRGIASQAGTAQADAQRQSDRYSGGSWNQNFGNWLVDKGFSFSGSLFGGRR